MVRLKTRVINTKGQPFAAARVRVLTLTDEALDPERAESPRYANQTQEVALAQGHGLNTGRDGACATPQLDGGKCYVLVVDAPGHLSSMSEWTHIKAQGEVQIADVELRRLISVEGEVVDRAGRPLAEVSVFQSGDGLLINVCYQGAEASNESRHSRVAVRLCVPDAAQEDKGLATSTSGFA
jgi:hypothetical protein